MTSGAGRSWRAAGRTALRLAALAGLAWGAHRALTWASALADATGGRAALMLDGATAALLVVYALLIALPFVPGVEIGIAILVLHGPSAAPPVYVATLAGLSMAYASGRWLSPAVLARALSDLRLRRAAAEVVRLAAMSPEDRVRSVAAVLPARFGGPALQLRYVALALAVNLPGTAIVGGGGGILLAAGFSRMFAPVPTLATLALAVLPVPLGVWLYGARWVT